MLIKLSAVLVGILIVIAVTAVIVVAISIFLFFLGVVVFHKAMDAIGRFIDRAFSSPETTLFVLFAVFAIGVLFVWYGLESMWGSAANYVAQH